jgi:energy-coupling factor transporter ATP-binding protein EcfA2
VLRELSVHKFRGLRDFTMTGLGRVNLLVGANNCGKTSVLEALHLLLSDGNPLALWPALRSRRTPQRDARSISLTTRDVSHLFEGHEVGSGSAFHFAGKSDAQSLTLDVMIVRAPRNGIRIGPPPAKPLETFGLRLQWNQDDAVIIPLLQAWEVSFGDAESSVTRRRPDSPPVDLFVTGGFQTRRTVQRLENVVLTENEELLLRALRAIEPGFERIAPVGPEEIVVKLAGTKPRIPLDSMGDGMWRMLDIALSIVGAAGGVLLIDEIDTGLHYSVMGDMWRLVYDAAKQLDVQVFAATHSRDCTQSLAAIVHAGEATRPEVTIQRIERGNPRAVAFTDDEIRVAAEIGAEVR